MNEDQGACNNISKKLISSNMNGYVNICEYMRHTCTPSQDGEIVYHERDIIHDLHSLT